MAYVPGLTVTETAIIRKKRTLPVEGQVLEKINDIVNYNDVVAKCVLPGDAFLVDIAGPLSLPLEDTEHYTQKKVGEKVKEGEILASASSLFGLFKKTCISPCIGTCEMISNATGKVLIRGEPKNIELKAYIPGKIVEVESNYGVTIETSAVFIQGIFGIGGETQGKIQIIDKVIFTEDMINDNNKDSILVCRSQVTIGALKKALEVGVKGIVVGSISNKDLIKLTGKEIGVAITGNENIGITLILTEGFGDLKMAEKSFKLFEKYAGKIASINGATQIRAGVIRPEAIIPIDLPKTTQLLDIDKISGEGMTTGTPIRIINEPYFGALAKVVSLPVSLQLVESGSMVRVLEAELENGERVFVPRANVELIEGERD